MINKRAKHYGVEASTEFMKNLQQTLDKTWIDSFDLETFQLSN